jgi:hypothetical protein
MGGGSGIAFRLDWNQEFCSLCSGTGPYLAHLLILMLIYASKNMFDIRFLLLIRLTCFSSCIVCYHRDENNLISVWCDSFFFWVN